MYILKIIRFCCILHLIGQLCYDIVSYIIQSQTRCYGITANNRLGGMAYFTVLSNIYVGYEVLSSGYESSIFWDIILCSPLKANQSF
jgi:hypothetical protein